ncbi:hypothetical protein TSTA_024690 [Talaromyces stipitatus ATCC 10500]|uniref:Integrase catalytic domain-containing protein n=1 Tax=Talaromyces stipitatus (strain ATCC 10500 / CBS 375.48 / QM 6759 / NRRL 1006) TaxID=441959 RepID=B8M4F2_TALSN|nr:uncharacterized protein TSTA_024690 [Talaromyces stipitatus ATCC 10500]EED19147.1 hypothetical protein TSTA_024690 [Talaromyces stipitatus ATCC 10500]
MIAAIVNHRYLLDACHKQTKGIISLREWMRSTVSPSYASDALDTAEDIQAAYLNLENQVDFLNTVRSILSLWVSSYEILNESEIEAGDLSFRLLSGAFRRKVKNSIQSDQGSRIGKNYFPVLHDEEAHQSLTEMDASHEENGDSDIQKQKGTSRKRKSRRAANVRVGDKDLKCKACQGYHDLQQCFYLFPKRAYEGWTKRESIRRRVNKNLEQDHSLTEETCAATFYVAFTLAVGAAMSITKYPLKNSAILDSGSTLYVFNKIARFINFRRAPDIDVLWAGDSPVNIIGYGDLRLFNVAYCPSFATNLVLLRQLQKMDYWWDNRPSYNCLRRADNTIVAYLKDRYAQFVLEDIPNDHPNMRMAFFTARKPVKADAIKWHLRLGHPGPEAMRHLVNFHDFETSSINGFKCLILVTDRYSGLIWDYYLTDWKQETILMALQHLFNYLDRQYKIKPLKIKCDNEILKQPKVKDWLHSQEHVDIKPSPPDTQALDGAAERSGGVVKDKARAMRDAVKLPADLSPEIYRIAVYLLNRTPRY